MEQEPIRVRLSDKKGRFGRLVLQKLEHFDTMFDIFPDDAPLPELDDTQEIDMSGLIENDK